MFDFQVEFGGNTVPYINIITDNNSSYNLLGLLEDSTILSMVYMIRDLVGVGLIGLTILTVILNLANLLSGEYKNG